MDALRDIAPYVALATAVVSLVLLVLLVVVWISLRRLRRSQVVILGHHGERDLVEHVVALDEQVRNMREAVETMTHDLDRYSRRLDRTITRKALVRFDAFREVGGEQSASLALLDSHRSGIVLSTIAARDFARVYVKHLEHGIPDRELSPEENEAVSLAVPLADAPPIEDAHSAT
ncbi:MAG: DUF4446 family protein [Thermoleophilia bacterium]